MAGSGTTTVPPGAATGLSVLVVAGMWHEKIADSLVSEACLLLAESGADYRVARVSGSFELPVAAAAALAKGADAVVALGVIIRGETPHFEFVAQAAADGLQRVALDAGKPVGFGVLTVENEDQAYDRSGLPGAAQSVGREAAAAAINSVLAIQDMVAATSD